MTAPTATEVRTWSKVDFPSLGYADDPALQVLVDRANAFVVWATGRKFSEVPSELDPLMQQAVQYQTENLAYQDQPEVAETMQDFMLISSFSAGPYSETRRSLGELKDAGWISADPRLNGLLWGLLTDDQRDLWLSWLTGVNAPAFEVTEVDWRNPLLEVRDNTLPGVAITGHDGIWSN